MFEFFRSRSLQYEIHVCVEGRWRMDAVMMSEDGSPDRHTGESLEEAAVARARACLAQREVSAVKVIRERRRSDGVTTTREIFAAQAPEKKEAPLGVGRVAPEKPDPAICESIDDLYRRPSCRIVGKLLRGFLDRHSITPLELLHHWPYARQLEDHWTLVSAALGQIARQQADALGVPVRQRSDELSRLVDLATKRVRDSAAVKLPGYEGNFAAWYEAIAGDVDSGEQRYFLGVGIARHLQGAQSLAGRLDFALEALEQAPSPELRAYLDEFVAGCLESPQLVMDLLGYQPNLAAALVSLATLASAAAIEESEHGMASRVRPQLQDNALPESAAVLWERLLTELTRGKPLMRNEENREWEALMQLRDTLPPIVPAQHRAAVDAALADRLRRFRENAAA